MIFADIHCHMLPGMDDGAQTEADMHSLIDASYQNGVRYICFTPHFHLGYFGTNYKNISKAFSSAENYVKINYPDLSVKLGNELRYAPECLLWLEENLCRTLGDTGHLLVDFSENESDAVITKGLHQLLNAGYIPVLAHAERYPSLRMRDLQTLRDDGVLIQADTQSLFGAFGFRAKFRLKTILRHHLADFISSDAHNTTRRPPEMSRAYHYIKNHYGTGYAKALCCDNALRLLWPGAARKV